jgi:DNA-directed RNA polymerase subunit RPC12/RpoP
MPNGMPHIPREPHDIRKHGTSGISAYCIKCHKKMVMVGPKSIRMKNGKPATQGVCPKCGSKLFRIGRG